MFRSSQEQGFSHSFLVNTSRTFLDILIVIYISDEHSSTEAHFPIGGREHGGDLTLLPALQLGLLVLSYFAEGGFSSLQALPPLATGPQHQCPWLLLDTS